jgi:hypothetical protein
MKVHKFTKFTILALFLVLGATFFFTNADSVNAEESNRNEIRAGLASGGWYVVYGDLINEHDYLKFGQAVAESVALENPAPIYAFFNEQLEAQVEKIARTAPEIGREAAVDLLIKAFDSEGRVLRNGRLEVSADLATYNRWQTVIYDEPRTYTCKQDLPFGGWTWSICTTMERVEKTVPLPNNFQPYFRFRWVSQSPEPRTRATPHGLVCLRNRTNWDINYRYRWGEAEWKSQTVSAGHSRFHWWNYAPGSHSSPNFEIRFDADFTNGTDYRQYDLKRYRAADTDCWDGKVYEFKKVGSKAIDLYDSGN